MAFRLLQFALVSGMALAAGTAGADHAHVDDSAGPPLILHARQQVKSDAGYRSQWAELQWDPHHTAAIVCDMWDDHWCHAAAHRVAEMAPRMNETLAALRRQGVLIIYCPSDVLGAYAATPQRKLAQQAPPLAAAPNAAKWHAMQAQRELNAPPVVTASGCDCQPRCPQHKAWSRQIATLTVAPNDAFADGDEALRLMRQRGITNVIMMGVHTNICVLGRPFGIRQMVLQGQHVVLVRDLTDSLFDSATIGGQLNHFCGTDLVIEHIERSWCPTITSADLLGGLPFRFAEDRRPRLVAIISEPEYHTDRTLPEFVRQNLTNDFATTYVFGDPRDGNNLPGVESLRAADICLLSVRRRSPPKAQLDMIRKFVADGKPIVGIRTASHAFALNEKTVVPAGHDVWPEFDRTILGGNYHGHHTPGNPPAFGWMVPEAARHPILAGIDPHEFQLHSSLYLNDPLPADSTLLMMGRAGDLKPHEPIAWTHRSPGGGRVFYTSLGGPEDFRNPRFVRLLANGIRWAASLSIPAADAATGSEPPKQER